MSVLCSFASNRGKCTFPGIAYSPAKSPGSTFILQFCVKLRAALFTVPLLTEAVSTLALGHTSFQATFLIAVTADEVSGFIVVTSTAAAIFLPAAHAHASIEA